MLDIGVLGIVLAWFMIRMEGRMERMAKAIAELSSCIEKLRVFLAATQNAGALRADVLGLEDQAQRHKRGE